MHHSYSSIQPPEEKSNWEYQEKGEGGGEDEEEEGL